MGCFLWCKVWRWTSPSDVGQFLPGWPLIDQWPLEQGRLLGASAVARAAAATMGQCINEILLFVEDC
jgi:hypothetical protein